MEVQIATTTPSATSSATSKSQGRRITTPGLYGKNLPHCVTCPIITDMSNWSTALERRITERTARVTVVGMGYVGLSLAVELARAGLTVRGIDLDLERVNRLNRGESYLVDVPSDALGPLVTAGTLTATTTFEEAGSADVIIICAKMQIP